MPKGDRDHEIHNFWPPWCIDAIYYPNSFKLVLSFQRKAENVHGFMIDAGQKQKAIGYPSQINILFCSCIWLKVNNVRLVRDIPITNALNHEALGEFALTLCSKDKNIKTMD